MYDRIRLWPLLALPLFAVALSGCGEEAASESPTADRASSGITVYAASSLREAFTQLAPSEEYSFGSSGTLQTQVERGAPADVFASASPEEAQALFRAGLCSQPVTFATNVVVMLVPEGNPGDVRSVHTLTKGDHRLAVGAPGVPAGDYTRELLTRLGLTSILSANTVTLEADAAAITAKVGLGSVDAGFAYRTDGRIAADRVDSVGLPRRVQPPIRYQACVVRREGVDTEAAQGFVDRLGGEQARAILKAGGFGLPPR